MTSDEFKQLYQETQERLGNRLQALSSLNAQINYLIELINRDYAQINALVETFFDEETPDNSGVD